MKRVDVTINITTHGEGVLAYKTLRSIYAGIIYARERGLNIECNIALDNADKATTSIVQNFTTEYPDTQARVYSIAVDDISLSRNYLIGQSHGAYIAFFDGDDFFTENYIYEAFKLAETKGQPAVYSPRYLIVFEGDHYLVEKIDSTSAVDVSKNMFETNYSISQSFISKEIYDQIQYQPNSNGYGMEDWHFSCQAMALGYKFFNVPNTIFFYRRKNVGSLLTAHVQSAALIRSTKLFEPVCYAALPSTIQANSPKAAGRLQNAGIKQRTVHYIQQYELVHHYAKVQYTLHRNIIGSLKRRYLASKISERPEVIIDAKLPTRLGNIGFTKELVFFWGRLNQYEPMIRASADMLQRIPIVGYPETSILSDAYHELCRTYQHDRFTDLVLVPHLVRGGADLAAIYLIKELSKKGNVLVITTLDVASPWLSQLVELENVAYVEAREAFADLDASKRELLIVRLIQNWGIQRLSIVNSELGYKLATKYVKVLSDVKCKTYLHTYAFDMTNDGYIYNAIPNGLVDAYPAVDQYITDSLAYKEQLQTIHGFTASKISALYLPVDRRVLPKRSYTQTNKVLWASRVSSAKLVEVAVEVGKQLATHNIELHIYGDLDSEYAANHKFEAMIKPYNNIVYHGGYEGFASLNTNDYDMFLLTTKNEGMPSVVLEALMANIFVVAPAVGGIPECINEAVNGALVANKFDASSYTTTIVAVYQKKLFLNGKMMASVNKKVLDQHSVANYAKQLKLLLAQP